MNITAPVICDGWISLRWLHTIALLIGAIALPVQGGDGQLFYNVGGLSAVRKNIVSVRERRYNNLVQQQFDFSCGAAALSTILQYAYNKDLSELQIVEGMLKVADENIVREKGFSMLDMKRYIISIGMRARGYNVMPEALEQLRIPTVVRIDTKGYQHFVVLKRVIGETVHIADPALGNRVLSREEFLSSWNGIVLAVIGSGFDRETALNQPEQPLTAHKFLFSTAPITSGELLDFGFSHAELF